MEPKRKGATGTATGSATGTPFKARDYVVDVLLECAPEEVSPVPRPPRGGEAATLRTVPVRLPLVVCISKFRVTLPNDLKSPTALGAVMRTIRQLVRSKGGADKVPRLGLVAEFGYKDEEAATLDRREEEICRELEGAETAGVDPALMKRMRRTLEKRADLQAQESEFRRAAKRSMLATFHSEAQRRTAVLTRLGHVDASGIVTLKGRAACEIDTADELVTTELMFNGVFAELDVHQLVALVACLVPVEKTQDEVHLSRTLGPALIKLQETARHVAEVSVDCKLDVDAEEYVQSFRPSLMDVVYAWSKGAPFADVCRMTELFEGTIIRAVRRLHELMGQLQLAAVAIGDTNLAEKFKQSADTIHRDVMFAASLYV